MFDRLVGLQARNFGVHFCHLGCEGVEGPGRSAIAALKQEETVPSSLAYLRPCDLVRGTRLPD
jgi:hypothetical protein